MSGVIIINGGGEVNDLSSGGGEVNDQSWVRGGGEFNDLSWGEVHVFHPPVGTGQPPPPPLIKDNIPPPLRYMGGNEE